MRDIEQAKIDVCEHIDSLTEKVCSAYCKWKSEYKDPDDLHREQCDRCRIWEMAEEIQEEIDERF